jgi:hypothetical protein
MKQASAHRTFHIYPDRVEIWVAGEHRGGWPLYTEEDLQSTLNMARELSCEVHYADGRQLELFREVSHPALTP